MFEQVQMAPPDPILGLTEAYKQDPNPAKINLGVGVYKDEKGATPVLASVKEAERRLLDGETTKSYLPINGPAEYGQLVQELLFGKGHEILASGRAVSAQTPGGTGALRIAGDYLKRVHSGSRIWLSNPTWPNHPKVFEASGLELKAYRYFDAASNGLAFEAMLEDLQQLQAGDVVLLHGCCHNPTGVDPTVEQWKQIGDLIYSKNAIALVDFAYQGFAQGIEEDAAGLRAIAQPGRELIVCSSFSKNFGLYNERIGGITFVAGSSEQAGAVLSQVKTTIRTNYSNPPAHGGAIVTTVLSDPALRQQWADEVKDMRDRINGMRKLFVQTLKAKGADRDFSFIETQNGMFSFSGLTKDQVQQLRDKHAIYIVGSGRINVAGMTADNMERLCEAIVSVL